MATSSKKITYTSDFKLKVLDYYFKNGGDEKFGLKKKTAGHFNIDKKTINRMLNNPDMVKRARKLLSKRVTGSAKGAAGARPGGAKATAKSTKVSGLSSKASGSKAGTAGNKLGTSSTSSKLTSSSHISASDTSSSSYKIPTSSAMSTKHVGSNLNSQGSSTSTQTSTKSNSSKIKYMGQDVNSGVQVFDLPEDPDYSLLKRSISASANGVANIARLLVTGTEEVRNIILNECDMILECKVCHNLFRSVVNFLAHKRIYCQEEFADVRTLFHKDDVQGITSHSSTVIVEPEPPPDIDPHPSTSSAPEILTKTARTAMQGNSSSSGIDSIAAKLASRKKHSITSHASHTGSSKYFERLDCVSSLRDKLSRDCSVVLEDIAGVTNARYQTFVSPTINAPTVSMNAIVDEVSKRSAGLTVAINEHGEIMKTAPGNVRTMDVEQSMVGSGMSKELICRTCNTRFATQKTLSVHQRSHHGFERCIYCCPICKSTFLSMWAVVKHLQRYHKKTKSQTERLRKVIKKNVYKKMVYHSEDRHGEYREMDIYRKEGDSLLKENQIVEEEGTALEENSTNNQSTKREIQGLHRSTVLTSPRKCSPTKSPLKKDDISSGCSPEHRCVKCDRRFMTAAALISHDKFCSLLQMRPDILPENPLNPRLRSETPEKKIAIQIRKDYKKTMIPHNPNILNHYEENKQNQISFKVPDIPKEQEKENHRKIEMMMSEFCNMTRLTCIPCEKRYQTITTLKRHASQHFNWTRYACRLCKFRSYHRYETIRHCISDHKANEHSVGSMILDDESFGPLRYILTSEDDTSISSDADDPENHGSLLKNTSESHGKVSTGHFTDTQNSREEAEGVGKNIKPPPGLEEFVSKSHAKENISSEVTVLTAKEKNVETTDLVKVGKVSGDTKIQNTEDNEKVPETRDILKSLPSGEYTGAKPNPSTEIIRSVSENFTNYSDYNTATALTSGLQNVSNFNSEHSCEGTLELDKRECIQTSGASSETNLSVSDRISENSNTVSDSKSVKGNQGIFKQYPLRGQMDSMGHGFQISDDPDEAKSERPQRLRRSVEQKDFIYDIKRSGFQKPETDSSKRNSIPKKGEHKSDDKPMTRRRNTFPRSDMPAKKIKITSVCSPLRGCNGTTSELQNKKALSQSGSPNKGKGRNSQLAVTRIKDISSSHHLTQTQEQYIKPVMQSKTGNDAIVSEKLKDGELLFMCKTDSSHNIENVSQIKGATTEKLDLEGLEYKPSFVSEKMENSSLELGCQKKLEDTLILKTKEDSQITPYVFENGKVQTDGDSDKDEVDQKSRTVLEIGNGNDPVWEKGKGEKTIEDTNPKEQKAGL